MDEALYRRKVMGCWQGKAVGGTLGMPIEGARGPLRLSFYDPVPTDLAPNDDLELQVLWGVLLDRMAEPTIDRKLFADAWVKHNKYPCDEYGIATRNIQWGIYPPHSGRHGNFFIDGLGAAIRSEIWACLAPGDPALAAKYAYEDGCVDHDGDGLYAEIFFAALESAAFGEDDIDRLIAIGLEYIPADCRLAQAIRDTGDWCHAGLDFDAVRRRILERYGNTNFTDVVMNIPFVVAGLLLGGGDFGRTVCTAVNFGRDTDCTGATAGAIFGILHPEGIGSEWLKPIGNEILLSQWIVDVKAPATIQEFADLVCDLRTRVKLRPEQPEVEPDYTPSVAMLEKLVVNREDCRPEYWEKAKWEPFPAPGWCGSVDASEASGVKIVLLRGKFYLDKETETRFIFNTDAICFAFLDGEMAFMREGGHLLPATHRPALNQSADAKLAAGEHEFMVHMVPAYDYQEKLTFYFGIVDMADRLWIPGAFHKK